MAIQYITGEARIATNLPGPYNITGSSNIVQIKVDGGSTQTATLTTGGARTAAQIVTDLGVLTGVNVAVVTLNSQDFVSITTATTNGSSSTIQVLAPVNNANTVLGLTTVTVNGNPRYHAFLEPANTKQQVIDFVEAGLNQCGWHTVTGSGSTNVLMQSMMSPQGLRYRLRIKDNSSNNVCFSIENVAGTKVGTNSTDACGLIFPGGRTYRLVANKYQMFIFEENSSNQQSSNIIMNFRSAVFAGVPYVPSNLVGTIYEAIYILGNSGSNGDTAPRGSFRDVIGSRNNNVGGNGNICLICNGNIWEIIGNSGVNGIGMPTLLTLWQGVRLQRSVGTWYRWHDDSEMMVDPLIAWGLTANTDEGKVRGQLWESFVQCGGPYPPGTTETIDGRTYVTVTINNGGTGENARATLKTAIT